MALCGGSRFLLRVDDRQETCQIDQLDDRSRADPLADLAFHDDLDCKTTDPVGLVTDPGGRRERPVCLDSSLTRPARRDRSPDLNVGPCFAQRPPATIPLVVVVA